MPKATPQVRYYAGRPRCHSDQLAVELLPARDTRFAVAQDAPRDDPRLTTIQIRGMSDQMYCWPGLPAPRCTYIGGTMKSTRVTNVREVLAFFLAQGMRIVVQMALPALVLTRFYGELSPEPMSIGVGALLWFAAFALFVGLRGLFGGAPESVAGVGRERAFISNG